MGFGQYDGTLENAEKRIGESLAGGACFPAHCAAIGWSCFAKSSATAWNMPATACCIREFVSASGICAEIISGFYPEVIGGAFGRGLPPRRAPVRFRWQGFETRPPTTAQILWLSGTWQLRNAGGVRNAYDGRNRFADEGVTPRGYPTCPLRARPGCRS